MQNTAMIVAFVMCWVATADEFEFKDRARKDLPKIRIGVSSRPLLLSVSFLTRSGSRVLATASIFGCTARILFYCVILRFFYFPVLFLGSCDASVQRGAL